VHVEKLQLMEDVVEKVFMIMVYVLVHQEVVHVLEKLIVWEQEMDIWYAVMVNARKIHVSLY
jgi:hypothetical protein